MKICFKCKQNKELKDFYKHPRMGDGYLGKCKECSKKDCKVSNGKYKRICIICNKEFNTTLTEIKRGGAICCSRKCWYIRFNKIVKRDKESPNWKGDLVGKEALHNWVQKYYGKPRKCEDCKTTTAKFYDWANISRKYKRDLKDWKRLCRKCHNKFDYKERISKWKKTVKEKYNWNTIPF